MLKDIKYLEINLKKYIQALHTEKIQIIEIKEI